VEASLAIKLVLLLRPSLAPRKHAFSLSTAFGELGVHGAHALLPVVLAQRRTAVKPRLLRLMVALRAKARPLRLYLVLACLLAHVLLIVLMDLGPHGVGAL